MVSWGGQISTYSPNTRLPVGPMCDSLPLMMLGLVLLAHGHLIMSSEICKICVGGALVVVGNAGEIMGSKVTPRQFKTPNRLGKQQVGGGLHKAAAPQPFRKGGIDSTTFFPWHRRKPLWKMRSLSHPPSLCRRSHGGRRQVSVGS